MKSTSQKNKWLTVVNSTDTKDPVEIHVSGFIGDSWWDDTATSAAQFKNALDAIPKGKPVVIKVNSEGGIIKDGLGIYDAVKSRSADITTEVIGYACSTASWAFLPAGKVRTADNAIWMEHEAAMGTYGNKRDHSSGADCLGIHDDSIAAMVAKKTGKTVSDIKADMEAETWMTGTEAKDYGLADEVIDTSATQNKFTSVACNAPWMNRIPARFTNSAAGAKTDPPKGSITPPITAPAAASFTAPDQGGAQTQQKESSMDRTAMIALLNKWGVKFDKDASDEVLNKLVEAGKPTNAAPAAQPAATVPLETFNAEKRKRIRNEVLRRAENRIANDKLDWWVNLAMNDEDNTLAQIDALPINQPGGAPVGGAAIEVGAEGAVDVIKKQHKTASARYSAMAADWNNIIIDAAKRDARSGQVRDDLFISLARAGINPFSMSQVRFPTNANTITSVLTSFLMDGSVTDLQNRWAMLRAFSLDTRPDGYKPLAPGVLKHVTAGSTAQTNATNYESGNSTVAPVTITPAEHSVSYQISNTDLNSGVRMQDLVTVNTANFANLVIEAATAPITTTNFTGATTISAAAAFSFSDLATLQALLKKSPIKNLIIDGAYIARISNTPGFFQTAGTVGGSPQAWRAFGWDGIYQNTDWTGAGTNVQGFACNPQAIGGIIGLPILPAMIPGGILSSNVMTVDGLDVQVLAEAWFNPATRTSWNSLRVMDGWAKVDATSGYLLTNG